MPKFSSLRPGAAWLTSTRWADTGYGSWRSSTALTRVNTVTTAARARARVSTVTVEKPGSRTSRRSICFHPPMLRPGSYRTMTRRFADLGPPLDRQHQGLLHQILGVLARDPPALQ